MNDERRQTWKFIEDVDSEVREERKWLESTITDTKQSEIRRLKNELNKVRDGGAGRRKAIPNVKEPLRNEITLLSAPHKSHWDYLLDEMAKMHKWFQDEKRDKENTFKDVAKQAAKYVAKGDKHKRRSSHEQRLFLIRVSQQISKEVERFWKLCEKLFKHQATTRHYLKQREKNAEKLEEFIDHVKLAAVVRVEPSIKRQIKNETSPITPNKTLVSNLKSENETPNQTSVACNRARRNITSNNIVMKPAETVMKPAETVEETDGVGDDWMAEGDGSEEDNESTLDEEEEMMDSDEQSKEVDLLAAEANVPIEELMRRMQEMDEEGMDEEMGEEEEESEGSEEEMGEQMKVDDGAIEEGGQVDGLINKKPLITDTKPLPTDTKPLHTDPKPLSTDTNPLQTETKPLSTDTNRFRNEIIKIKKDILKSETVKEESDMMGSQSASESTNDLEVTELSRVTEELKQAGSISDFKVSTPIPNLIRGNLRPYQHVGLHWLSTLATSNLNGILADEMGLGKTIQTIALLAHLAVEHHIWGPHLVVVPTSVMINWEMEFKRWCPGFKVLCYFGSANERRNKRKGWGSEPTKTFHVCIASYTLVVQDQNAFKRMDWCFMILDEAQNIKNFKSQRWQTMLTFNTKHRLLLTGTPLQNDLMELWSLMHFLMPKLFASHSDFKEWFSNPLSLAIENNQLKGNQDTIQRLHTVLRPFLLRRLKKDVEKQMPCKYEHVVKCSLATRQRGLYDEFMETRCSRGQIDDGSYIGLMNCLMQLRKVCNHPDLFEPRGVESPFVHPFTALSVGITQNIQYPFPSLFMLWEDEPWNQSNVDYLNKINLTEFSLIHYELNMDKYIWERLQQLQNSNKYTLVDIIQEYESIPLFDDENAKKWSKYSTYIEYINNINNVNDENIINNNCESIKHQFIKRRKDPWGLNILNNNTAEYPDIRRFMIDEIRKIQKLDGIMRNLHVRLTPNHPDIIFLRYEDSKLRLNKRIYKINRIKNIQYINSKRILGGYVLYGETFRNWLKNELKWSKPYTLYINETVKTVNDYLLSPVDIIKNLCPNINNILYNNIYNNINLNKYICITSKVIANTPELLLYGINGYSNKYRTIKKNEYIFNIIKKKTEPFHNIILKNYCLFPDKLSLTRDCGKLVILEKLLRKLKNNDHRCIIFTQMSKMLNVLEKFINLHNYTYVRLDGSTKVEDRQRLVTHFNVNKRLFLFISSTRAGGVGINLTGADTVIFYDSDWNPAMDRQAMDRCHRIGQTRDVHIYRLVSEHSIEENIFRKQLQKRLLDDVVVDMGKFTTDYFNSEDVRTVFGQLSMEETADLYQTRTLHDHGGDDVVTKKKSHETRVFEEALAQVEDEDDQAALKVANHDLAEEHEEFLNEFEDKKKNMEASSIGETVTGTTAASGVVIATPFITAFGSGAVAAPTGSAAAPNDSAAAPTGSAVAPTGSAAAPTGSAVALESSTPNRGQPAAQTTSAMHVASDTVIEDKYMNLAAYGVRLLEFCDPRNNLLTLLGLSIGEEVFENLDVTAYPQDGEVDEERGEGKEEEKEEDEESVWSSQEDSDSRDEDQTVGSEDTAEMED
eukprot:GHVL01006433.1.p1 GENE.GHVL01006433.1~~GHVL01006433.1.p1  ORF type:complete len:1578 (+),score=450.06 GHVL01006433.1:65-4798(+)